MADVDGDDELVPVVEAEPVTAMEVESVTALEVEPFHTPSESVPQNTNGTSDQPRTIGGFIVDDEDDEEYTPMLSSKLPEAEASGLVDVDRGTSKTPQPGITEAAEISLPTHDIPTNTAQEKDDSDANEAGRSVSNLAPLSPNSGPPENETDTTSPLNLPVPSQSPAISATNASHISVPKARLPNDRVGILEDRIKEDPRGDVDAWLSLIDEYKKRNKLDEARAVYERYFKVFPSSADHLVAYSNMELEHNDFYRVEQIFNKYLLNVPNVLLWSTYLNYVRRRNNLTTDSSGNARKVVTETYEFVLQNIGIDKDSGPVWQDYVQFLRSGPEQVGGNTWQDQQKMDTLRRVYQRAICIPTQAVNPLWKEYDAFEMGINKQTGRKFLQEKSATYMTARSPNTALHNLTGDLNRTTLPRLPPAPGFEGDVEYTKQVEIWKKWIEWEKDDPLVLKDEDVTAYRARILYVYKQAVMALRFWPEIWVDAAEFCYGNGLEQEGNDFIGQGIVANPESCLLAFQRAGRIEATTTKEESEESIVQRGAAVRDPHDKVLDALYELCGQVKQRETQAVARIEETFAKEGASPPVNGDDGAEDDDVAQTAADSEAARKSQVEAVRNGFSAQLKLLGKTISFVWIALMRAMRRVQGKGKLGEPVGGSRQIFADARKRGRLTSDVYVASAMIEYHCYKDPAATKIFERGMKLFPEDELIALEFVKHLVATNDITNARSVFETSVTRLTQSPHLIPKAKPLFAYFHEYESHYGELSQIIKLEKRMRDLFPTDSKLRLFSLRYTSQDFDPTAIRLIVSPAVQARPRSLAQANAANTASLQNSPRPAATASAPLITLSPKRPLEDSDTESLPAKKMPRSESPLKGAAGRRLDAQKRTHLRTQVTQNGSQSATPSINSPTPLPPEVYHLLSIIPKAETYNATPFSPEKMVDLLRTIDLSKAEFSRLTTQSQHMPTSQNMSQGYSYQPQNPTFAYGR